MVVTFAPLRLCAFALIVFSALNLRAEDAPKFLGSQACSTSGCHGGAGEKNRQFTVWAKYDVHHERPFATLTTARAERIAETLKLGNVTTSARCTVCHAPFQTVPAERLSKSVKISEGVSCENCHGPAENWLLSHTRKDYTHTDRVHAGMRDLQNLYVRANTCVACHQNVDADILAAGHPELIFELDGQAVTQPKHWQEATNWNGAQAWEIGQEVANREMNWQLANEKSPAKDQINRWAAIGWVMSTAVLEEAPQKDATQYDTETIVRLAKTLHEKNSHKSDVTYVLSRIDSAYWLKEAAPKRLSALANTSAAFRDTVISQPLHARRAERLVLALDRLTLALPDPKAAEQLRAPLKKLFADVQSLPDFAPATFADHLAEFQKILGETLPAGR